MSERAKAPFLVPRGLQLDPARLCPRQGRWRRGCRPPGGPSGGPRAPSRPPKCPPGPGSPCQSAAWALAPMPPPIGGSQESGGAAGRVQNVWLAGLSFSLSLFPSARLSLSIPKQLVRPKPGEGRIESICRAEAGFAPQASMNPDCLFTPMKGEGSWLLD